MIRSLNSAITGLKNHQTKMDVTGNNIANVNTLGFKRSKVTFSTMFSQTIKDALDPMGNTERGGTNAIQLGQGVKIGSIDQVMTQGLAQATGIDSDLMIQGNGMFVLDKDGQKMYTRAGSFGFDSLGRLEDPSTGALVQGFNFVAADDEEVTWTTDLVTDPDTGITTGNPIPSDDQFGSIYIKLGSKPYSHEAPDSEAEYPDNLALTSYNIDKNGLITGVYSDGGSRSESHKIAQLAIAKFDNYPGLKSFGDNFYIPSSNSGQPLIKAAGDDDRGIITSGSLEGSNVDLAQEFTDMIITQRGYQASAKVITTSDSFLQEIIDLKR